MPEGSTTLFPAMTPIAGDVNSFGVNLHKLHAWPLNPRRHKASAEADAALEDSIVELGILETLLVRPHLKHKDEWEVIAGGRRYACAKAAEMKKRLPATFLVPARVINVPKDDDAILLAATENLQREDMPPLDEAEMFKAIVDVYKKAGHKDPAQGCADRLKISRKTVFNRLRLLRCAPEVQDALAEKKIGLGQAEALAKAEAPKQKQLLKEAKRGADANWLRENIVRELIAVDTVDFDLKLYTGEIVDDEASGKSYFADGAQALKLQRAAVAARKTELLKTWKRVEIVGDFSGYVSDWGWQNATKGDPDAIAAIFCECDHRMSVRENVWDPDTAKTKRRAGDRADTIKSEKKKNGGKSAPARLLSNSQVEEAHRVKTQAMRRGLIDTPKAALVLAILGLAGKAGEVNGGEIGVDASPLSRVKFSMTPNAEFDIKTTPEDADRIKRRLAPLSAYSATHAADAFAALMKKEIPALLELLAALMVPLVGTHTFYGGMGLAPEDTKLAVAIAGAVGAKQHVATYWKAREDYLLAYPSRDPLLALGKRLTGHDETAMGSTWKGGPLQMTPFAKMKKGELAKFLLKAPADLLGPEAFPELAFTADRKAMTAAALPKRPTVAAPKPAAKPKPKLVKKAAAKKAKGK